MTTSVRWKVLLPRVIAAAAVAGLFVRYGKDLSLEKLHGIAGVIAGVSGTLLGFLITAVALLTAIMDRTLVANMRKTGHYQRLVFDSFSTCAALLGTVVTSILSLFLDGCLHYVVFTLMLFVLCLGVLYAVEAGRRFSNVISNLS